jgi:N-acetylmuramoyl-L-alanine amidase
MGKIMAYTVYLDAGHGGYDNGASDGNRREKNDTLRLALAVGEILQNNGVDVGYTRVEDVYDSPLRKAQIANEAGADLFVSFHRNAAEYRNQYNGVQTLIFDNSGVKKQMADAINEALAEVGFKNIGTEVRRDLAVLRRTKMPALLVEAGFIDSDTDNAIFDENFDDMAQAIAYAILNTLEDNGLVASARQTAAGTDKTEPVVATSASFARKSAARQISPEITGNISNQVPGKKMTGGGVLGSSIAAATMAGSTPLSGMEVSTPGSPSEDWQSQESTQDAIAPDRMATNTTVPENTVTPNDTMLPDDEIRIGKRSAGRCICVDDDDEDDDDEEDCKPCYMIQTGLYRNYQNALRQKRRMERDGFPAMIQLYKKFYAVVTGYFESEKDVHKAQRELRQLGYETLIRTVR